MANIILAASNNSGTGGANAEIITAQLIRYDPDTLFGLTLLAHDPLDIFDNLLARAFRRLHHRPLLSGYDAHQTLS